MIGASNLRGTLDPLRLMGYDVRDVTTPGWVASPQNIKTLSDRLCTLDLSNNIPVVLDLMSNSAFRFVQYDGTQSLPHKMKTGYHLPGDVTLFENGTISKIISLLEPVLSLVSNRSKIVIPPLPRYIVAGCCLNEDHCTNRGDNLYAETILKDLTRSRNFIKTELGAAGVTNYWVLDWAAVLGEPKPASVVSQLDALKAVSSTDGVHFKKEGYANLAKAINQKYLDFKNSPTRDLSTRKYYWKGFISCEGSSTRAKTPHFSKKKVGSRAHPYKR